MRALIRRALLAALVVPAPFLLIVNVGEDRHALPLSAFSVSERGEEVKLKK